MEIYMNRHIAIFSAHPQAAAARPGCLVGHTWKNAETAPQSSTVFGKQRQDRQRYHAQLLHVG